MAHQLSHLITHGLKDHLKTMHDVREIKQYGTQNHDYTDNKSTME